MSSNENWEKTDEKFEDFSDDNEANNSGDPQLFEDQTYMGRFLALDNGKLTYREGDGWTVYTWIKVIWFIGYWKKISTNVTVKEVVEALENYRKIQRQ